MIDNGYINISNNVEMIIIRRLTGITNKQCKNCMVSSLIRPNLKAQNCLKPRLEIGGTEKQKVSWYNLDTKAT